MSLSPHLVPLFASLAVAFCGSLSAQDWASEERPLDLSEELPSGADPGGAAFKGKILRLTKTSGGLRDGRLVVVYADANHDEIVWAPRSLDHLPRDVFARTSDDEGKTWSDPVNLSNSAGSFSASTDWDGDGVDETYWGDCSKANVFSVGDSVVVSWVSKYAPEPGWTFGTSGASSLQGTISYPDLDVYPNTRVVPYAAVWCAISNDGGTTWAYGDVATQNPPLQLSYGNRDAIQDVHRGTSGRWVMTWQEDPEGLQPGDAEGPGLGASGAKGSKGTDVWYTYTADIVNDPLAILANRTPLTNHSTYDATQVHFPLVGQAGTVENHASTRANLFLMKDGAIFRALVAYEETKGIQDVLEGKTVNYHSFPFDQPVQNGPDTARSGAPGTTLTDLLENSRRVRFVAQPPNGVDPAICIFWKQGLEAQGAPSDILLKTSLTLDEAAVDAAPILNVSANTPAATPLDLANPTMLDPFEDARAHRAYMRGSFVMVGFTYTPNQALARYTNLENYDFWVRRSFDGGATWAAPRNLSNLPKDLACREPRVVGPAKTGTQDDGAILVAWGTETNVWEGASELPEAVDIQARRTLDFGETFTGVQTLGQSGLPVDLTEEDDPDEESQFRVNDDASVVYGTWMADVDGSVEYRFIRLHSERFTPGDRLRVEFVDPGTVVDIAFDAVRNERLKLKFPAADEVSKVEVSVWPAEAPPPGVAEPIDVFTVKAGKRGLKKVVPLPESGRYRLRFAHVGKELGPFEVKTGRRLPVKAKARKLVLKPDPDELIARVRVLALEGATIDLKLNPKDGWTGPLSTVFWLPDGTPFDASGFAVDVGDIRRYVGVPTEEGGDYVFDVLGFGDASERVKAKVVPHQPAPGSAILDLKSPAIP